jgi:hypothetical protein
MAVNRLNVGATNQLLSKASSGQSTNILELQNTAGTTVAGVDASGNPVGTLIHPPTFKNIVINGAMQVAQRGTSKTSITTSDYYTSDRWLTGINTLGTWTQSVENDAPTGSGFRKSTKMLCTTADASLAAGDFLKFDHRLEGQNVQQIAKGTSSAKQLTVSFWVKSNVTGTYIVEIEDFDNSRTYNNSYTISASATWEKKTMTIPADTTGALDSDNNLSLVLSFWLAAGSNFTSGTLQTTWGAVTNANRAVGQTNLAASTNNYWQITGVQLEVGNTATDFEFLPIDAELARCQRYYFRESKSSGSNSFSPAGMTLASNRADLTVVPPVQMRVFPTSIDFSNLKIQDSSNGQYSFTSVVIDFGNERAWSINGTCTGASSGRAARIIHDNSANASYLGFSAEL